MHLNAVRDEKRKEGEGPDDSADTSDDIFRRRGSPGRGPDPVEHIKRRRSYMASWVM